MNPLLFLAAIAGGAAGILVTLIFHGGYVAPPSPGSIFALLAVTPHGGFLATIASVAAATGASFAVAAPFVKSAKEANIEEAQEQSKNMKINLSEKPKNGKLKIVVACDAGMGSSAVGATMLKKVAAELGADYDISNCAISNLDGSADVIITQKSLTKLAQDKQPEAQHLSIDNFMNKKFYKDTIENLQKATDNKK